MSHRVELVRAIAGDGVRLDGALRAPHATPSFPIATDGITADSAIVVHGTGGNFYGSTLLDALAVELSHSGLYTLQINTRGHDAISTAHTPAGPRRLGAAYEVVSDCRLDLAAWVDFLSQRGLRSVVLVGHSLGAVKCAYYLAHDLPAANPDNPASVVGFVAASPPRIAHRVLLASRRGEELRQALAAAEQAVQAGNPDKLIELRFPLPYFCSAEGVLDKYGPEERYDVLPLLERVRCPWMASFAERELTGSAFVGLPEACTELGGSVVILKDTDHFYIGARQELAQHMGRWLRKTLAARDSYRPG